MTTETAQKKSFSCWILDLTQDNAYWNSLCKWAQNGSENMEVQKHFIWKHSIQTGAASILNCEAAKNIVFTQKKVVNSNWAWKWYIYSSNWWIDIKFVDNFFCCWTKREREKEGNCCLLFNNFKASKNDCAILCWQDV